MLAITQGVKLLYLSPLKDLASYICNFMSLFFFCAEFGCVNIFAMPPCRFSTCLAYSYDALFCVLSFALTDACFSTMVLQLPLKQAWGSISSLQV